MQHGRLGIGIQALDQTLAQSFGLPDSNGALVGQVEKDSPAAKAGFKSGDVIRKIDGVAVVDSTDVTSRIGNTAPGTTLNVEVWRDGKARRALGQRSARSTTARWRRPTTKARPRASSASPCGRCSADEQRGGGKSGLVVEQRGRRRGQGRRAGRAT